VVNITEDRDKASRTEALETEEALLTFLRKYNLDKWTPEEVLEQLMLPPRPSETSTKFQVVAREAKTKRQGAGN
jgi:hypothetical protein